MKPVRDDLTSEGKRGDGGGAVTTWPEVLAFLKAGRSFGTASGADDGSLGRLFGVSKPRLWVDALAKKGQGWSRAEDV